jgi:hypothetical protein
MKKLLLIALTFFLPGSILLAQNWRPFNSHDSAVHYLSEDSVQVCNRYLRPIHSVIVDSSFNKNNFNVLIFKKGYSVLNYYSSTNESMQIIEGNIFGDSAYIGVVATSFSTLDPNGFNLIFPTQYNKNTNYLIGSNSNYLIWARVDSLYSKVIPTVGLDSIVKLSLSVKTANNTNVNHHFDSAEIYLSKNHGFLRTIDFTDNYALHYFTKYDWKGPSNFQNQDRYKWQKGDEFHTIWSDNLGYGYLKHLFQSDTVIGVERILTVSVIEERIQSSRYTKQYNYTLRYDTNELFNIKYSAIIEDSIRGFFGNWQYQDLYWFGISSTTGQDSLVRSSLNYGLWLNSSTFSYDTISPSHLAGTIKNDIIGSSTDTYSWGYNGNGYLFDLYKVVYSRRGNTSWGNPVGLFVNVDNYSAVKEFTLYPNPARQYLYFEKSILQSYNYYTILDINSQLIQEERLAEEKIHIADLKAGVYFLRLIGQDQSQTYKFIKQ